MARLFSPLPRLQATAIKPLATALGLALAGLAAAQARAPYPPVGAWDLLGRTMETYRHVACKSLIMHRDPMARDQMMEIWSEQSADGHLKLTVLGPLTFQGVISVDNGHQWMTYHPDEHEVFVQSSPREEGTGNPAKRMRLARHNYALQIEERAPVVAGRRCICLLAQAKHPEMPDRRYYIDPKKKYLLRMEIVSNGQPKVMLDTRNITYMEDVPEEDFELDPPDTAKLVTLSTPVRIDPGALAKGLVGFKPAVPKDLPFGFVVESPELVKGDDQRYIAVRITDGLVSATIYEANRKRGKLGPYDRTVKSVGLRAVGELPSEVRKKLLDAFVKDLLKSLQPGALEVGPGETFRQPEALNIEQSTNVSTAHGCASARLEPKRVVVFAICVFGQARREQIQPKCRYG